MDTNTAFIQFNLRRSPSSHNELEEIMFNAKRTIALVQEPFTRNNKPLCIPGNTRCYYSMSQSRVRAAIIATRDLKLTIHSGLSSSDAVACELEAEGEKNLLISSMYCDRQGNFSNLEKLAEFAQEKDMQLVCGADANAWSFSWGDRENARGRQVEDIMIKNDLHVENVPQALPTYHKDGNAGTFIDVTLSRGTLDKISSWQVHESTTSDHNRISFRMAFRASVLKRRVWDKTDWKGYREYIQAKAGEWSNPKIFTPTTLDRMAIEGEETFRHALDKNGLVVQVKGKVHDPWHQSSELRKLKGWKLKAHAKWKRFGQKQDQKVWHFRRTVLGKAVRKYERQKFQKDISELKSTSDMLSKIKSSQKLPPAANSKLARTTWYCPGISGCPDGQTSPWLGAGNKPRETPENCDRGQG